MSYPLLSSSGSFMNPFPANPLDEANPQPETMVFTLDLDRQVGPVQYYTGYVGSGNLTNNTPHFDYSIQFAFTWNPEANMAEVKAGRIRWFNIQDPTPNLENGEDEAGHIACFECKRYDEYISVGRTMNAVLANAANAATRIKISEFTDEERAIYRADEWRREERAYECAMAAITWPANITTETEKVAWINEHHYEIASLRDRIEMLFLYSQSTEGKQAGDHYFSLDATLYGPFPNKEDMHAAIIQTEVKRIPAQPCRAYITPNGQWRGCADDEFDEMYDPRA